MAHKISCDLPYGAICCNAGVPYVFPEVPDVPVVFWMRHLRLSGGKTRTAGDWVFNNNSELGRGAFSKVYKGQHRVDGRLCAAKITDLEDLERRFQVQVDEVIMRLRRESRALRSVRHTNVIALLDNQENDS